MKLLSIRLHPFGQFKDTSRTFTAGMNVVEGPNEFGKSTLSNAIKHALFTSTQLTPSKMDRAIGDWYPHPLGSHCSVTLTLEHDGNEYILEKEWPKNKKGTTTLAGPQGMHLANTSAEEHLAELIGFNLATWECVFHTSQAALAETVQNLSEQTANLDDLVASSDSLVHDVSPERLRALLEKRVKQHYSNWDDQLSLPRDNRGIGNPWKQSVGTILSAYYEWKQAEQEQAAIDEYNEKVDRLQQRRNALTARHSDLTTITATGIPLRDQLQARESLSLRVSELASTVQRQREAYDRWPMIDAERSTTQENLVQVQATIEKLELEVATAQHLAQLETTMKSFERIVATREALHQAQQRLQGLVVVQRETVNALQAQQRLVQDLDTKIAAHTLRASITAANQAEVRISMGKEEAEYVQIVPKAPWQSDAIPGLISIEHAGLTIAVQSATGDVDQMLEERRLAENDCRAALTAMGLQTIEEAVEGMLSYEAATREVASCQLTYEQLLEGKSFAEWEQECAGHANQPQTRPLAEINSDVLKYMEQRASLSHRLSVLCEEADHLAASYTSRDDLFQQLAQKSVQLNEAKQAVEMLPDVPEGYSSVQEYLGMVRMAEQELNQIQQDLARIEGELHSITAPRQDISEAELADRTSLAKHLFDRAIEEGTSLIRIQGTFERIVTTQQLSSPLQNVRQDIAANFHRLTQHKYTAVEVDGTVPLYASTNTMAKLNVHQLSRGTITSLALATRAALAEAYLQGASGMLMLDDPFTDMDAGRRTAAQEFVKELSGKHQIIMFTCHSSSLDS